MTQNTASLNYKEDRRRYFRVDDSVNFIYRVVPSDELPQCLEELEKNIAGSFSIITNLNAISQQMTACLHKIEQRNPEVASYLKALDQKVEMVGRAFLAKETGFADQPTRAVNLSAGGMSVCDAKPLKEGTTLEIKMLLVSSFTGILAYGTVVSCEPVEEGGDYPYCLRIDFTHIRDIDRDALIRHLLRRQGEQLRKRREKRADRDEGDLKSRNQ